MKKKKIFRQHQVTVILYYMDSTC